MKKSIRRNDLLEDELFEEIYEQGFPIYDNVVDLADEIFQMEEKKPARSNRIEFRAWKKKYNELCKLYNEMSGRKVFNMLA